MDDRHPIKFSLGQFILLMTMVLVILALVFILGARFGDLVFPQHYAKKLDEKAGIPKNLTQQESLTLQVSNSEKKLNLIQQGGPKEEAEDNEFEEDDPSIPQYQVGENGELLEEELGSDSGKNITTQKETTIEAPLGSRAVIRFKSSGHSRFTIQVGEFFDQALASRKIDSLKKQGYDAYLSIKAEDSRAPAYQVRVGVFADRQIAEDFATKLSNDQGLELQVVSVE